jgi:hypothetical protein
MSNRLLLVTESEAAYIAKALELWLTIHVGEFGRELGEKRALTGFRSVESLRANTPRKKSRRSAGSHCS